MDFLKWCVFKLLQCIISVVWKCRVLVKCILFKTSDDIYFSVRHLSVVFFIESIESVETVVLYNVQFRLWPLGVSDISHF